MQKIIQNHLYNYDELSYVLEWKSKFYFNIYNQERIFPNYYKINLVGSEFSPTKENVKI